MCANAPVQAEESPAEIVGLAEARLEARKRGDFDEADRLRGAIEVAGWEVRDVDETPGFQLVQKR